jgi:hypothetical protein
VKIVLVHSGPSLPKHLIENLRRISRTFPNKEVVTLVDDEKTEHWLNVRDFKCFRVSREIPEFLNLTKRLKHDATFMNGFWYLTIKRFYIIQEYLAYFPESPILHIESDVILLPNFPFDALETVDAQMAFPLVSETHAAASIFLLKDKEILDRFLRFLGSGALDHSDTDMTLLAKFARIEKEVSILPTLVPEESTELSPVYNSEVPVLFNGVFDAATYGQFLFGVDPKNNLGIRKVFSSQPHHLVNPSSFAYELDNKRQQTFLNITASSGKKVPLYNIHVHSKDIRVFRDDIVNNSLIAKRCSQSRIGKVKYEIDFPAVFQKFPAHAKAILFLLAKSIRNIILNQK